MKAQVTNSTLKHRFESDHGSLTAFLNYRVEGDRITFTHTEVPASLNGRGIGTALVKAGLDYARQHNLKVIPQCPFVADFIAQHQQFQTMLVQK